MGSNQLNKKREMEEKLERKNTKMMHAVLNKSWMQPPGSTKQPPTSHLKNHPSKTKKMCKRNMDKLISNILVWTPTYGHSCVG